MSSSAVLARDSYTLETLPFTNSFARLPAGFHTRLNPSPLPDPYLVGVSHDAAALIGLDKAELSRPEFIKAFSGNQLLPGSEPLAAVYSGHQFGAWAGQLGDGRAHLLGEVRTPQGAQALQLKGAGRTPYSRGADGRAVLRSSIREFLCSEAMAALGIPTTRALCVIGSDLPVQREANETAAVVTRVAPSFVRFGSFEHWSSRDRNVELQQLADYVLTQLRRELLDAEKPYEALLRNVAYRTGVLIAQWQGVGFMHGVMNTDNMSILGLTLDYGPFGFMEAFDAGQICNHSDHSGRYAFRTQPRIAHWNLYVLADALRTLIGHPDVARSIVDEAYHAGFNNTFSDLMHAKLGLTCVMTDDDEFIGATFGLLHRQHIDYSRFFRRLSHLSAYSAREQRAHTDAHLRDLFLDRDDGDAWLLKWRVRLQREASNDCERQARMLAANPKYILRNWMAEAAIRKAQDKDFSEVEALLQCLRHPFEEQPEFERYAALPPEWAQHLHVSCSS